MTLSRPAAALIVMIALTGSLAAETGEQAFEARDYGRALFLLRAEAEAGSASASLRLGTMADLGLGIDRDAARAFRWYLAAAEAGLPEAQFNVGVMLDAGVERTRDAAGAAVWYARAAANGHARAQYNLGLLYAAGDGVATNADLARHWLRAASANLAAAEEKLAEIPPTPTELRVFDAPGALSGSIVETAGTRRAELVWTGQPAPIGVTYMVEVDVAPNRTLFETDASSVSLPISPSGHVQWRVMLADKVKHRYAASRWQVIGDTAATPDPGATITLRARREDSAAMGLAQALAEDFRASGQKVEIGVSAEAAEESRVRFRYQEDAEFAAGVAAYLPGGATQTEMTDVQSLGPGDIVVELVGGPSGS